MLFDFFVGALEREFPGTKPIIDEVIGVLQDQQAVIDAVIVAIKNYVPGTPVAEFLTALQQAFDALVAASKPATP